MRGAIDVEIAPDPSAWRSALSASDQSPQQAQARAQLGLPSDQPIVFSGHQPIVFHNGILAKLIAQHEASLQSGAQRVWIVADQDPVNPGLIRVPQGSGLQLRARQVDLLAPAEIPDAVASCALPAMEPSSEIEDDRLIAISEYLMGYAHETSLARQFASATITLACDRLGFEPPTLLYASELFSAEALWDIVSKVRQDPRGCVSAYNDAVARFPKARVRPLRMDESRIELPLWGIVDAQPRVAVDTQNIDRFAKEQLMPRGLLMSALVRAHLGELFIHGTGGWEYDKITQQWVQQWLGARPAPMALTTATQRLDLGVDESMLIDLPNAQWTYHHARHHPALVDDHRAQSQRDACVEEIRSARQAGIDPAPAYQRLLSVLQAHRARNAQALEALRKRIERARDNAGVIELANERTWPFVLFDDAALHRLDDATRAAMR